MEGQSITWPSLKTTVFPKEILGLGVLRKTQLGQMVTVTQRLPAVFKAKPPERK